MQLNLKAQLKSAFSRYNLVLVMLAPLLLLNAAQAHPLRSGHHLTQNLAQVTPAIVNISVQKKMDSQVFDLLKKQAHLPSNMPLPRLNYTGSGVIINASKGYIITNNHVVKNSQAIVVTLKTGDRYLAKLIGKDANDDLAVLKIKPQEALSALQFANSDQVQVGENVIAVGHPFGLRETVTAGIISALNRLIVLSPEHQQTFMQTDAPINPGNSGGALVNTEGKLVGINTAMLSTSDENAGIGFAIPSNTVHAVYQQLIKYGSVKPGMLGVIAQDVTPALASALQLKSSHGIVITQINPNSAADKAGLKINDVILSVQHTAINSAQHLHSLLILKRPKDQVTLHVMRQQKPMDITATLTDVQQATQEKVLPHLSGMQLSNYHELQSNGQDLSGVLVKSVSTTSEGALAGLTAGDIITSANNQHPITLDVLTHIAKNSSQILLSIKHQGMNMLAVLR